MNGRKAIWEIEPSYPPNGERSGKQDRHRQDKTDSSSDIPDIKISRAILKLAPYIYKSVENVVYNDMSLR